LGKNIPNNQEIGRANGNKIFQMAVNDHIAITYQHRPLQDPPKFTQIGIFWSENIPSGNPARIIEVHICYPEILQI
jgi:hypothetical protein